jgi:hypothetical protein
MEPRRSQHIDGVRPAILDPEDRARIVHDDRSEKWNRGRHKSRKCPARL